MVTPSVRLGTILPGSNLSRDPGLTFTKVVGDEYWDAALADRLAQLSCIPR